MIDPKKSAEAVKKIQEIQHMIASRQSKISSIEQEKTVKVRYYDQQIKQERDEIVRHTKLIAELKRQI
jgi:hypothetical protein